MSFRFLRHQGSREGAVGDSQLWSEKQFSHVGYRNGGSFFPAGFGGTHIKALDLGWCTLNSLIQLSPQGGASTLQNCGGKHQSPLRRGLWGGWASGLRERMAVSGEGEQLWGGEIHKEAGRASAGGGCTAHTVWSVQQGTVAGHGLPSPVGKHGGDLGNGLHVGQPGVPSSSAGTEPGPARETVGT